MALHASFIARIEELAAGAPRLLNRALGTGGDYADLFYEQTTHHRASLRWQTGRRVVTPEQGRHVVKGLGIRVLAGAQQGFAATEALTRAACRAAAEEAAAGVDGSGAARQALPLSTTALHLDLPADAPGAIGLAEKDALLHAAAEAAFSLDDRVAQVAVTYQDRVRRAVVITADGVLRAAATLLLGLHVEVTLAAAHGPVTARAMTGGACGFGHFFARPPDALAREAVERAQRLAGAKPLAAGTMPVVLAAGWGGVWLHEAVGHLLEADTVVAGGSPFAGCLGRAVATPAVTLVDDATVPGGRGSYAFDDEATPAARTPLVEDGVLRGFLTDRRSATALSLPRTGNARRQDYRHAPLPRMTNLLLAGGDANPADLIASVNDGLYIQAAGHGVVRPGGGFSLDVHEGYRIEQGRLTAPVIGARLAGEGPAVLRAIVGVGHDLEVDTARGLCKKAGQVVPVSVGMPTVLIRAMDVL